MRSSVYARSHTDAHVFKADRPSNPIASIIFIALTALLIAGSSPVTAFAVQPSLLPVPEGSEGTVGVASSAEGGEEGFSHCPSEPLSSADVGGAAIFSEDGFDMRSDDLAASVVSREVPLEPIASRKSVRTFFLARALESTKAVPMVSAELSLEEGLIVGSFEHDGMTFAMEPGGESAALVAVDYAKLPQESVERQTLIVPGAVSLEGQGPYEVVRIAEGALSSLREDAADPAFSGASALLAEERFSEEVEDPSGPEGVRDAEEGTSGDDVDGFDGFIDPLEGHIGILALGVPASVTTIEDGAFAGSDTLQYLVVSEDNPGYASYDGALYDKGLSELLFVPEGRMGSLRIASSATEISPERLSRCPSIDAVVIDEGSEAHGSLEEGDLPNVVLLSEDVSTNVLARLESNIEAENQLLEMESRETKGATQYYESVYTFVACVSMENEYYNDVLQAVRGPHYGSANGYAYGRFTGDRIYVATSAAEDYMSLRRYSSTGDETKLNYYNWQSTEVGKFITGKFYWNRELTNPVAEGFYDRNVDVFLGWNYTNYTLSYASNGGSGSHGSITTLTVNQNVTFPTASACGIKRAGYTLTGWSVNGRTYSPGHTINIGTLAKEAGLSAQKRTDTILMTAQWAPNTYTITYNANGGTISVGTTSYNVESNDFTLPTSGTRTGYTFAGWDVTGASGAGVAGNGTTNVTIKKGTYGNLTATAKWTPVEYSISWDTAGGTISGQKTSYNIETADYALPAPTRTGYTFAGWEVTGASGAGAAGNGTTSVTIKRGTYGNLTAKAKWSLNTYHLSWDVFHGAHANRTEDFTVEDCPIAMGEATPYDGYAFTGWSGEKLSGSPSSFTLDASFLEGRADGTTLSFTAGFSANPYTIRLHANDGTGAGGLGDTLEHAVTYDAAVADAEVPKRYGYAFSGYWTKNDDGSKAELYFDEDGAYVKDTVWKGLSDVDLYACWTLMGDLEVPISSPSTLSFTFDRATGQASASDGSSSSYGLIRSSMPEEVPVASVALEALRGPDGTSVPEKLLGKGNPEECAMEVVFSAGAPSSKTALLRFASPAGSAEDETLWEFPSTDRPLIPSATSVASGTTGDGIVSDGLGNLARAGELTLSYALKTLSGFDVYKVPLADGSEDVARIVFTVDLTGVVQERF